MNQTYSISINFPVATAIYQHVHCHWKLLSTVWMVRGIWVDLWSVMECMRT